PTNSWGGAYNVSKSNNSGRITFNDFSGPYSGPSYENDPYNRIDWFVPELSATPLSRTVDPPAGSTTFNITSNVDWAVSESVAWFSVTPMSGSNNGVITVNYLQNSSASNRSGIITLSATGVPDVTLTVIQSGAQLSVNPAIQNLTAPAGSTTFNVVSNAAWNVSESASWFSVSPIGGTGNGTLTVNYTENTAVTPRSGTITVSSVGIPNVTVTVTQAGATPVLSVAPASRSVTAPAGSTTFGLTSNTAWSVSESVAWFTVAPMSGSGNNTLTVNYQQNTSVTPRSGQITVSAAGVPDVVVTVNQAGAGAILTVSPSNRDVTPPAGNTTFSVNSNTSWAVSESITWLSVTPMSGSGNITLNVNYGENASGSSRTGNITVTATGGSPSQTVTISQESYPTHLISLPEGWSGLSSYIMPANNDIADVFSPVSGSFVIATTMTDIYYPAGPVNTIIDWESQSAYKLKMNAATSLPIIGNEETNKTFSMTEGWNLMPVISNSPVNAAGLFSGVSFEIVKDVAGVGLMWPEYGINTLGFFVPGRVYVVKMNSADAVTFPPNVKNAVVFEIPQTEFPSHPWNEIHNGPSTHSIAILVDGISGAMPGDIIGIFDKTGQCFGIAEIANLSDNVAITAFADDPYSYDKDGFEVNDPMYIKLFRPATSEVFPTDVSWDDRMPNSSFFEDDGISVISGFKVSSVGMNEALASSVQMHPNPSNGLVEITGIERFNQIEIFNAGGEMIRTFTNNNENLVKLNLTDLPAGIYQVKFSGHESSLIKKLIKN
ncbi:MAG: T9SS type A sorting domain-containing protein, partial [Bacteroidales bacterium]|nr:T9SS type A sorting domain-containing protein [Bacteroidales bacterium]